MVRIAVLASGSGSNAEKIIRYFENSPRARVAWVLTNNPKAGVLARAGALQVPCKTFDREDFSGSDRLVSFLSEQGIGFIVLAGFLWLVPSAMIRAFPGRIVNIHPALLPAFGGKGYYGEKVHQAVIASGTRISGITVHAVNEHFDEGAILFQAACRVAPEDDPVTLANKIHALEHAYFPVVIDKLLRAGLPMKTVNG